MYREKIDEFFAENKENLIADILALVKINSVRTKAEPEKPFGAGPAEAMAEAEKICRRLGLITENHDNYVVTAATSGAPEKLGILAHLDVVEAGTGWSSPPFEPKIVAGRIFGRGTADDKGPAVAAAYALAAAKQICPELPFSATLILGGAEETGSEDIHHFFATHPYPPMSFSPDASFPVINIEKGAYGPEFSKSWEKETALPRVLEIKGGKTNNIVPQIASARVAGISLDELAEKCADNARKTKVKFDIAPDGEGVFSLTAVGKGAHASTPEKGNNAQTALLSLLDSLSLADGEGRRAIASMVKLFPHGDTDGTAIGVKQRDEISGALTLNFGVLDFGETGMTARFDSRVPLCGTPGNMSNIAADRLEAEGFCVATRTMRAPHHTPSDSPLVATLLGIYESYTGEPGRCLAIGGGTYVHDVEGGVAFGCEVDGIDNHMHGPDEFVEIERLIISAKMFTSAILTLCE